MKLLPHEGFGNFAANFRHIECGRTRHWQYDSQVKEKYLWRADGSRVACYAGARQQL